MNSSRTDLAGPCAASLAGAMLWAATAIAQPANSSVGAHPADAVVAQATEPPVSVSYLPYAARGHALVPPTLTPTPLPTPTPRPAPPGHALQCVTPRTLDVCTWLSTGEVTGGDEIAYGIRLLENGRPVEGAEITVRWQFPYPAVQMRCDATTDAGGEASCGVMAPRLASGNSGHAQLNLTHNGWPYQRLITFTLR